MDKLLDDIRKDAIKKSSRSSHRHSQAALEEGTLTIIKSICMLADEYNEVDPAAFKNSLNKVVIKISGMEAYMHLIGDRISEGFSLEHLTEYATSLYWTDEPEGFTALLFYLVIRGMVLIREGADRDHIAWILSGCVPQTFLSLADVKKIIKK